MYILQRKFAIKVEIWSHKKFEYNAQNRSHDYSYCKICDKVFKNVNTFLNSEKSETGSYTVLMILNRIKVISKLT